ncbi:MAG: recombinase family protein [Oscillospiraceae bacterium]|nr:recombinase family protein [Oscillospiraceae bacterium]
MVSGLLTKKAKIGQLSKGVSTEEQAKEGYSIRAQIDKLKNYITIKDWEFYKVYADEGAS